MWLNKPIRFRGRTLRGRAWIRNLIRDELARLTEKN